jgi:hypothetical protein
MLLLRRNEVVVNGDKVHYDCGCVRRRIDSFVSTVITQYADRRRTWLGLNVLVHHVCGSKFCLYSCHFTNLPQCDTLCFASNQLTRCSFIMTRCRLSVTARAKLSWNNSRVYQNVKIIIPYFNVYRATIIVYKRLSCCTLSRHWRRSHRIKHLSENFSSQIC